MAGFLAGSAAAVLVGAAGYAQTDEIQVYDAEINEPGQFSLQLHNNYTPVGRTRPDFPGGVVPNHTLNGVPEWALGITEWLELGAYAPLYSWTGTGSARRLPIAGVETQFEIDPVKKFRSAACGTTNSPRSFAPSIRNNSGEIRPIIGGRIGPVDLIINPIIDTSFQGLGSLDFAPAARLAYNISGTWAVALKHYSISAASAISSRFMPSSSSCSGCRLQEQPSERRIRHRPWLHTRLRQFGHETHPVL